ncbi:sigma-70 family RNA polymerase sigma factor [Gottfriedia acidiceleris]|uniref:sigma-70 family RNA polymerase sigma factor n=1 Tax=Gottfriedia acidiceleris TaxID=371036 RepID=UPI002FFE3F6E
MNNNRKKVSQYLENIEEKKRFIVEKFLEDNKSFLLFVSYLEHPDIEKQRIIDSSFKKFLFEFRKKSYYKSLIRYKSIDFDKRINKLNNRNILSIDKPIKLDVISIKNNIIVNENPNIYSSLDSFEQIENDVLRSAIKTLTPKQQQIIKLIYFHHLSQTEAASMTNSSPQNINRIHKKAIEHIKSKFNS